MAVKLVFASRDFPGYAGIGIVYNDTPGKESRVAYKIKQVPENKLYQNVLLNFRFSENYPTSVSVKGFLDDLNHCSSITDIVGRVDQLKHSNIDESLVIGGCKIIRLFDELTQKFLLFIGGKSETFYRTIPIDIQDKLAKEILLKEGAKLGVDSIVNCFGLKPRLVLFGGLERSGLTSQELS